MHGNDAGDTGETVQFARVRLYLGKHKIWRLTRVEKEKSPLKTFANSFSLNTYLIVEGGEAFFALRFSRNKSPFESHAN